MGFNEFDDLRENLNPNESLFDNDDDNSLFGPLDDEEQFEKNFLTKIETMSKEDVEQSIRWVESLDYTETPENVHPMLNNSKFGKKRR